MKQSTNDARRSERLLLADGKHTYSGRPYTAPAARTEQHEGGEDTRMRTAAEGGGALSKSMCEHEADLGTESPST